MKTSTLALLALLTATPAWAQSNAEALDLAFVGLTESSALQAHLAEQARRLGRRLAYRIRLGSFEAVCRVVGEGTGVAVVPAAVACSAPVPLP